MKVIFRTCKVEIDEYNVRNLFPDGTVNEMYLGTLAGKPEGYPAIVAWAGYGKDWKRYAIEHELTHHFVADNLGWNYSWALYENTHHDVMPAHIGWEEHMVNRFQRLVHTGEADEYGVLDLVFGERLPQLVSELKALYKKVLDK